MTNHYLQNFRRSKGLSATEMAEKLNISKSFYEKVEYGARNPSFSFNRKLKNLYPDVDIGKLIQEATAETETIAPAT